MTENVENLILEHLKRFQATLDRVERDIREIKTRLSTLEGGQAAIMQHLTHLSAADAAQQVAIDSIGDRLNRIETRLELAS
jgi:uncharacterized coiled-coil protein SlyX